MEVVGVRVELPSNTPIVLLREVDEPQRMLPIFIGGPEATAIALALDDVSTPRPMTHDLMRNMLTEFEMSYERLDITSLADGTFYSEMHLRRGDKALVISSRPSDGIALAIRMGTPIFAAPAVLDAAAYAVDDDAEPEDVVEQFKEFIDSVNPDDFAS